MTSFTSMGLTILPRGWRQRKQPSRKHFASVQMPGKRTSHEHFTFITAISITMALWLSWSLHAGAYQMIPGYSVWPVTSKGARDAGKRPYEASSGLLSSTRVTLTRSAISETVTEWPGVMLNKNRS
jgi:hypothetical protein